MFFPPTDEEKPTLPTPNTVKTHNSKSRRKKKRKLSATKKKNKFGCAMSSWAENFTFAATWQLKHQLAFWKARAKSLEYENSILHEIIRKNCLETLSRSGSSNSMPGTFVPSHYGSQIQESESDKSETEIDDYSEELEEDGHVENGEFEVSEEFIQFLKENAKYKEDARQERERLKAKMAGEDRIEILEAGPSEPPKSNGERLKEFYGSQWQRIATVEMSVQSSFIKECDKSNPTYWPNIPFNFS